MGELFCLPLTAGTIVVKLFGSDLDVLREKAYL